MTRKHFKMIAAIISKIENEGVRKEVARDAAGMCRQENSRFDCEKFLEACNVKVK